MYSRMILITIFSFMLVLSGCSTSKKSNNSKAVTAHSNVELSSSDIKIEGKWDGLIQHGLDFIHIRLELSASTNGGSDYKGTAYAQQFYSYVQGHSLTDDIGSVSAPVTLSFDRNTNSFVILPGRQKRAGGLAISGFLKNLGGVYDIKKKTLVGLRNSRGYANQSPNTGDQYFLFSRPKKFKKIARKFEEFLGPSSPALALLGLFGGPDADDINDWAKKIYKEYPDIDLYTIPHGQLELIAIKLFRDKHFEKHFDDKFDDLSDGDLFAFRNVLNKDLSKSRKRKERSTGALNRMFWKGQGDNSAKQTTFWVMGQRHFVNWRQQQLDQIVDLPASFQSMQSIETLEATLNKVSKTVFWPSETEKDKATIHKARGKIAKKLINKELEKQIIATNLEMKSLSELSRFPENQKYFSILNTKDQSEVRQKIGKNLNKTIIKAVKTFGKNSHDITGYVDLRDWRQQYASTVSYLNQKNLKKSEEIISKRKKAIEKEILIAYQEKYRKQVLTNQMGLPSLKAGVMFENKFRQTLGLFASSSQFQLFTQKRLSQREKQLTLTQDELSKLVMEQTNTTAIENIKVVYLLPEDSHFAAAKSLFSTMSKRTFQLEPFTGKPGSLYLNALYTADFEKLKQLDQRFSLPYRTGGYNEAMTAITQLMDLIPKLAGFDNISFSNAYQESLNSMSLIVPVFAVYLVSYQTEFKECLEPTAVKFKKTTSSSTIHKYAYYEYTEQHPDQIEWFLVNQRFKDVFQEVGLSNPDSILGNIADNLFSGNNRVSVSGAVSGIRHMMNDHSCNSPVIRKMEQSMLQHFNYYMQGKNKSQRALFGG